MTEQGQVDWAEVDRRARAREPLFVLVLAAVAVGWAGLSDEVAFASGTAKWILVAVYVLGFVMLLAVQRLNPRLRTRARAGYRVQYALREHIDPGPELRTMADRQAAYLTRIVWFRWWMVFFLPAALLFSARWDRPLVTVPIAVLLVAGSLVWARYMRRYLADANRWVADPPGPPREMPPPRRWERWLFGWRIAWVIGALTAAGLIFGLVSALVGD